MHKCIHAGIEVSKRKLVVAVMSEDGGTLMLSFDNDRKGRSELAESLLSRRVGCRVVMESTGNYGIDLAHTLSLKGIEVMVANGKRVRDFAGAMMSRCKNDKVDALMLLNFAMRMEFVKWEPPKRVAMELRGITRLMEAHKEELIRWKGRIEAAQASELTSKVVLREIRAEIRRHEGAIERLQNQAMKIAGEDEELCTMYTQLRSIVGVGEKSALKVLGEIAAMPRLRSAKKLTAYAGLDPTRKQSGSSVDRNTGISRKGNRYLRTALYMPSLVAIQRDHNVRAYYLGLLGRGKTGKQALVAVMRKLLCAIFGMLKNNEMFDGAKFYRHAG